MTTEELKDTARLIRKDVIEMVYDVKDGHIGASYSIADLVTALYFGGILNVDPRNPEWEDRDRLILSKGHACPAVYSALIRRGFIPADEKYTLRKINSRLQGHPDMIKTPGIEATTGPLGNGLAMGVGMAKAMKILRKPSRVFVITGDGELQEGIVWEALQAAVSHGLDNLYIFVDQNRHQSGGLVSELSGTQPIREKMESFRLNCQEIDGHDFEAILNAVTLAEGNTVPSVIVCNTVKGKGIDFTEGDNSWHKRVPTESEFNEGIRQLEGTRT